MIKFSCIESVNMKIKYKKSKYNVKFKDYFRIKKRQILLFLRRVKRLSQRAYDVFRKDLIILLLLIIAYVTVVCYVESNYTEKSIKRALWDTNPEVFTVFVVVAMSSIISNEREWRKEIRIWHKIYADYLYLFENDIEELSKAAGMSAEISQNILYTRDLFDEFEEKIWQSKTEVYNKNKIDTILEKINIEVDELKENYYQNCFWNKEDGFSYEYRNLKENTYKLREKIEYEKSDIKYDLTNIFENLYLLISYTRMLWRTEICLDREIIDILKNDNENVIRHDFYLNLLSYKKR